MRFKNFTNLMYALLVVAGTVGFSGCSKDEDENQNPAVTSSNSASATIGTTNFVSTKMIAVTGSDSGITLLNLKYINQPGDTLSIAVIDLVNVNTGEKLTYDTDFNTLALDYILNYTKVDGSEYFPSNDSKGELTVTLHDKTAKIIKGTFSGTINDENEMPVNVTNGKFEAKY